MVGCVAGDLALCPVKSDQTRECERPRHLARTIVAKILSDQTRREPDQKRDDRTRPKNKHDIFVIDLICQYLFVNLI